MLFGKGLLFAISQFATNLHGKFMTSATSRLIIFNLFQVYYVKTDAIYKEKLP